MKYIDYEKFAVYTQKILNFNIYVSIAAIFVNLMIFIGVLNIDLNYLLNNQLIVFLIQSSSFPVITSNSLQFTLLVSLFLFIINVFVSIFLALYYLSDTKNPFFDNLKNKNKILYFLGFRAIYPAEFHKIDERSVFFKIMSLCCYLGLLFTALEWFIWFGILLIPGWILKLISNSQFFLFLWNIFLILTISFVCASLVGLSIILVHSIFRRKL